MVSHCVNGEDILRQQRGRQVPWSNVEIALCELGAGRLAQSEGCEVEPPVRAGRCRGATLRSHFINLAPDDVHDPKVVR